MRYVKEALLLKSARMIPQKRRPISQYPFPTLNSACSVGLLSSHKGNVRQMIKRKPFTTVCTLSSPSSHK